MRPDVSHVARKIANECVCLPIRQASRALTRTYDEALRPIGVQTSQLGLLVAVVMHGEAGASMGSLAQRLVMDRTTLTRNLRPLEKAGLVRVARSPTDARARIVIVTRAGERVVESALPLWEQAHRRVQDALGPRAVAHLRERVEDVLGLVPNAVHLSFPLPLPLPAS